MRLAGRSCCCRLCGGTSGQEHSPTAGAALLECFEGRSGSLANQIVSTCQEMGKTGKTVDHRLGVRRLML